MKNNIEIINNSHNHECYKCLGIGKLQDKNICSSCKGTGNYIEESFYLVTTKQDGEKIAFNIDNIGK